MARLKKLERRYLPGIRTAEARRDALVPALAALQDAALEGAERLRA